MGSSFRGLLRLEYGAGNHTVRDWLPLESSHGGSSSNSPVIGGSMVIGLLCPHGLATKVPLDGDKPRYSTVQVSHGAWSPVIARRGRASDPSRYLES